MADPILIPANPAAVRRLLSAAFNYGELRRFCYDRTAFREVLNDFSPHHGLNQMVDLLMTYCDDHNLWPELLSGVEQENPRQYQRFSGDLALVPAPAAGPDAARGGAAAAAPDPLPAVLAELRQTVRAHAPAARRGEALARVDALSAAATVRPPDLDGLALALRWFEAELPALSGPVLAAIGRVEPRAEAAGDAVLAAFWARFGRFG